MRVPSDRSGARGDDPEQAGQDLRQPRRVGDHAHVPGRAAGAPAAIGLSNTGRSLEYHDDNEQRALALISSDHTPEEQIGAAYGSIRSALVADLLERVADKPPRFFERLVLDVLRAMGYDGVGEDSRGSRARLYVRFVLRRTPRVLIAHEQDYAV